MNWKIFLVGLIMASITGTAYAASNENESIKKNLEISESWIFATANESEIGIFLKVKNNFPEKNEIIFPVRINFFYGDKKLYSRTIDINWFDSYSFFRYKIVISEKYDSQKDVRIDLVDQIGKLIDSKKQTWPRYKFDFNQQKADIQLVNMSIAKHRIRFWDDYHYDLRFTIKNMNTSYAFKGKIEFGDLEEQKDRYLQNWRVHYDLILEPSQSFEIERSGLTGEEIKNVKTELRACIFC